MEGEITARDRPQAFVEAGQALGVQVDDPLQELAGPAGEVAGQEQRNGGSDGERERASASISVRELSAVVVAERALAAEMAELTRSTSAVSVSQTRSAASVDRARRLGGAVRLASATI